MKKSLVFVLAVTLFFGTVTIAGALPISFDIDGPGSSVSITGTSSWGFGGSSSLGYTKAANLDSQIFNLTDDGDSYTFEFFDLNIYSEGFLSGGTADIRATLAFTDPKSISVDGSGSGSWFTVYGSFSGGMLTWTNLPKYVPVGTDSYFSVDFSDIMEIGFGNSATVWATITAYEGPYTGGGIPAPEPATALRCRPQPG